MTLSRAQVKVGAATEVLLVRRGRHLVSTSRSDRIYLKDHLILQYSRAQPHIRRGLHRLGSLYLRAWALIACVVGRAKISLRAFARSVRRGGIECSLFGFR